MQGTGGLCSFVLIYRNTRPPQGVFYHQPAITIYTSITNSIPSMTTTRMILSRKDKLLTKKKPNRQPISVISIKVSVITISILILRRTAFTGKTANRFG